MTDIRRLVSRQALWCILPTPTDKLFARYREHSFVRMVLGSWPLLIMVLVLAGLSGPQLLGADIVGRDALYWWRGLALLGVIFSAGILLLHFQTCQRHYQIVIVVTGCLSLAVILLGTLVMESERLMRAISYGSMLTVTIQVLALKLSLRMAALASGSGILLAVGITKVMGVSPDWDLFIWHSGGSLIVNLVIAAVQERQERISFLRGLLLEYESAERERLNTILERHASEDQLTGLPNRRVLNDVLLREWERASRSRKSMAVLFMDVDYFKRYNDSLGHLAGDDCLAALARAMQSALLRPTDLVARYGGEEFVMLLPETDADGAMGVARRVLNAIDACAIPHPASAAAPHVTISIGVAVMVPEGKRPQILIDAADAALYEAKGRGRHQIVLAP
ncbi:MAG: GGDEF domain-containing protein [Moraxellaceae bacterium]|nr:GGDEF domain-containing protein [Moraxellaceae bacterium]MBP9731373.1 GGDEF domain-containing protein [Moraxellaceae bacterium]